MAGSRAARDPGSRRRRRQPRPACSSSAPGCGFVIRWCARRPTGRRRCRSDRTSHRALAEVTDPKIDPDRRAWHRAQAAPGPDEDVAAELERSAGRAQARGGLAAAAAFLERAAMLTPEPARRAQRLLAAARAKRDAGALDAALGLLVAVEAGPLDALRTAEVEHLRGQIALEQRRASDAARLLLSAARRLEPLDADLARETHLEALGAAMWAGDLDSPGGVLEAAEAARAAPPGPEPPRAVDVLLDAFATAVDGGIRGGRADADPSTRAGVSLWTSPTTKPAAGSGSPVEEPAPSSPSSCGTPSPGMPWPLARHSSPATRARSCTCSSRSTSSPWTHLLAGELTTAARLIEEDRLIAEATGNPPVAYAEMMLAAWRGQEAQASELIEATLQEATARGLGRMVSFADYASSVLYNGLGRHDAARDAAWRAFERDQLGYGPFVVPELAEAASRTGDVALVRAALEWLSERTRVTPTEWALGIEARVRALLSEGDAAERLYRESIERLGRTRVRVELARAHLLYGEWLRRERRRVDAREQLRTAHEMLDGDGRRGVRRAGPARAAGHRRDRPQTHRRDPRRAHRPGGPDRAARPRRTLEPGDRHPAVHQPAHGQVPPAQGLHQARHQLAQPARPRPAQRPGTARPA